MVLRLPQRSRVHLAVGIPVRPVRPDRRIPAPAVLRPAPGVHRSLALGEHRIRVAVPAGQRLVGFGVRPAAAELGCVGRPRWAVLDRS